MNFSNKQFNPIGKSFLILQNKFNDISNFSAEHFHDAYEIYYLVDGERSYFIKNRTYNVKKGDLVFINLNELHRTNNAHVLNHERILINFKHDFLNDMLSSNQITALFECFELNYNAIRLDLDEQKYAENLLIRMVLEDKKKAYKYDLYLKIMLIELLLLINRHTRKIPQESFDHPKSIHKKISEVINYINLNYSEHLSLNKLCKIFYISTYYLSHVFKEVTGFNFIEYLNYVRINEARRLLKETNMNVTQIAEKVGYESTTHFGRVFKTIIGLSPVKYRKIN
jgi:AraC-like DNA-binding protein